MEDTFDSGAILKAPWSISTVYTLSQAFQVSTIERIRPTFRFNLRSVLLCLSASSTCTTAVVNAIKSSGFDSPRSCLFFSASQSAKSCGHVSGLMCNSQLDRITGQSFHFTRYHQVPFFECSSAIIFSGGCSWPSSDSLDAMDSVSSEIPSSSISGKWAGACCVIVVAISKGQVASRRRWRSTIRKRTRMP